MKRLSIKEFFQFSSGFSAFTAAAAVLVYMTYLPNCAVLLCRAAVLLSLLLFSGFNQAKSIVVAAGEWQGYTHANGSGLYFDIVREALNQPDLKMHIRVSNWKRAKHSFLAGRADILICDYKTEHPGWFYPRWHLDYDPSVQVFSMTPLADLSVLADQPVGWLLGYDFDQYLPVAVKAYEVASHVEGFQLLQHGRLKAFLSYQMQVPAALQSQLFAVELQQAKAMYPVFRDDLQGRLLAKAYDEGMQRLYRSGRLKALFNNPVLYQQARFSDVPEKTPD